MRARLAFVGVGPGDPELITRRAARLIVDADVIAYFAGPKGRSNARTIADDLVTDQAIEELLRYPVTTGTTDHAGGYYGVMEDFYDESAARLASHLDAGRAVVVLAEGDPLFYSTSMYLHDRLTRPTANRAAYPAEIVPGVTSIQGATAAAATALSRHEDVVTVLPGTLPVPELAWRLAQTDAAVIMKLGRTFAGVREALHQAGRLADATYVERATWDTERVLPVAAVDPADVPYFSIIIVAGRDRRADAAGRADRSPSERQRDAEPSERLPSRSPSERQRDEEPSERLPSRSPSERQRDEEHPTDGTLLVVGLGPGPDRWITPEVTAALADVDHVLGYAPYVDRVPQRPGLTRHPSGNTVEVDRARDGLDLARSGARVAVVSGGDAGVFGMASAVFEAAEDPAYAGVDIRVLPGLTAAQVVAARAGAPLGADFAVMSLSDRLKPWEVIADRLRHAALADLVIALYNPRSRARPTQLEDARRVLLEVRPPETVVVVGRDVGRAEESLTVTTLGEFDPATVDMKCLVMIGATTTRTTSRGQVWSPRFVR
ncbi:precorrin-3B C(17)-methyltransferase [Mariniluteicoccus flavus]